jgi:signal transduction histidine kinase
MTTTDERPVAWQDRFRDELIRPFLMLATIAVTGVEWPTSRIVFPSVALPLLVLASATAIGSLIRWPKQQGRPQFVMITATTVLGAALLPLAHATLAAALFPYLGAATAGEKFASRRAAVGVAAAGSVVAAAMTWLAGVLSPDATQWPWWLALTVGLPVYIGISRRDRVEALHSARRAAQEAQRAKESEAREAALLERGRIAREIHDVLGHSLSGIALQLDMADALRESGRDDEATAAVRRARALAVDSIGETRRAVHALRDDTRPLPEVLRHLAARDDVEFTTDGEPADVGAEATHAMARVAQEALTNAVKYAPGGQRSVRLDYTAGGVTLTVHNGPATAPLDADLADGGGTGLAGMRERAALLGGTLAVGPAADGGWTVRLELPR